MARKKRRSGGTGTKKRSSSTVKKNGNNGRGKAKIDKAARIRLEIISIAVIAVGIFFIVAMFTETNGKVGAILDERFTGLFGVMAKAVPFFLITYGGLLFLGVVSGAKIWRVVWVAAIFIAMCIIIAGRYIEVVDGEAMIMGGEGTSLVYERSLAGESGGVLGTYFAKWLVGQIGIAGLYVFCIALLIVSGILLAGMPMSEAADAVMEKQSSRREKKRKKRNRRREREDDEFGDEAYKKSAASRSWKSGDPGDFAMPSFLSGDPAAEASGGAETTGQNRIIDAVLNDETYGDVSRGREPEIEDTNIPFVADDKAEKHEPEIAAPAPNPGKQAKETRIMTSDSSLGKRHSDDIRFGSSLDDSNYKLPPPDLLSKGKGKGNNENASELKANATRLEKALRDFRVEARVAKVTVGPTVTRYEVEPYIGVKIQSIRSLESDLALKLGAKSVRVVAMPGQSVIGIEAYNTNTGIVTLREMVDSDEFRNAPGKISFALGKNISGKRIVVNLKEMPHLLIAGTTSAGKSVCINSILLSILFRAKPSEVKLILIDPKVVELKSYNDLPHLLVPVVTDPERAAMALSYAVSLMEERYKKIEEYNLRNIEGYNDRMRKEGRREEIMPQIVIIIDELSNLMDVASGKVQDSISRLASMARAAGIHLVVATQQPLASVLTSIIKSNIPSRIAFAVSDNSASRVILDTPGAERLHGKGDMLFKPLGSLEEPMRVQGSFADDNDINRVVNYVKKQMNPFYSPEIMSQVDVDAASHMTEDEDDFFLQAVEMVAQSEARQVSVSMIQRRFRIGYNRAARIVDMMEERGIVAASDGTNKPRRLIMSEGQLANFLNPAGGHEEPYDDGLAGDSGHTGVSNGLSLDGQDTDGGRDHADGFGGADD